MPTKKRITVPGAIAHIMARGIDGLDIFRDDEDRIFFLKQLSASLEKCEYRCYGWVLMSNHYHLVVRCSDHSLDGLMRTMNSRYAKYYNKKYQRHGYLFQDRFKSVLTQDQNYLEELIRYVHLNPLRAGICEQLSELDRYQWCGHSVLMGIHQHTFQTTKPVLRRFGSPVTAARAQYRKFISKGIKTADTDWIVNALRDSNRGVERNDRPACWVIGDREFVISVMQKNKLRLKTATVSRQLWPLEKVFARIAAKHELQPQDLLQRSRNSEISECRKKFSYLCCRVLGHPVSEVAACLNLSGPAVSWAILEGEKIITQKEIGEFTILPPG